ncbi:MAG: serine protease [Clostridia bacterium]|nr:serine protease [Clostridia bacterium]
MAISMLIITTSAAMADGVPQAQFRNTGHSHHQETSRATNASAITTKTPVSPTNASGNSTGSTIFSTKESHIPTIVNLPATSAPESALLLTQSPAAARVPSTGDDYTTHSVSAQEQMMMNLINSDRAANNLPALTLDPELSRIARIKSEDMRDNSYFAHESPTYGRASDMLTRFGYRYRGAGENIAHHASIQKAQAAFMSSAGHRRNILSAVWEKVGVGVCYDRNGYIYATQIFVR